MLHSHIEFFDRIKHNHGIIEELNVYQIGQVIDGLYGEDIRKNTLDIEDNEKVNILSQISNALNIGYKEVQAAPNRATNDIETSSDGYLKQLLVITQTGKSNVVNVSYTATWLKNPLNRKIDCYGIHLKNASFTKKTVDASYKWHYNYTSGSNRKTITESSNQSNNIKYTDNGIACKTDLKNNPIGTDCSYTDHILSISGSATIDNKNINYVVVYGEYFHQESIIEVHPSITIGNGGSITFNGSVADKMNEMTPNTYIKFYYNK